MSKAKNHFQRLVGNDWVNQLEEAPIEEGADNGK